MPPVALPTVFSQGDAASDARRERGQVRCNCAATALHARGQSVACFAIRANYWQWRLSRWTPVIFPKLWVLLCSSLLVPGLCSASFLVSWGLSFRRNFTKAPQGELAVSWDMQGPFCNDRERRSGDWWAGGFARAVMDGRLVGKGGGESSWRSQHGMERSQGSAMQVWERGMLLFE